MALKNLIKLNDKVTFGRAGDPKKAGKVIKLNPKTAHIRMSNGDVMGVSYGLIQKSGKKAAAKKKPVAKKRPAKKNPSRRTTARPPGVSMSAPPKSKYARWLSKQTKAKIKQLDKALTTLVGSNPQLPGLKAKHTEVRRELRSRK